MTSPFNAGLGWAVKLKSNLAFIGRDACLLASQSPLTKMLAGFTVADKDVVLLGRETILRNGVQVGYLTSGGYGYTVDRPIGYGYVRSPNGVDETFVTSGTYELVVANDVVAAEAHLEPLYDPSHRRVRS